MSPWNMVFCFVIVTRVNCVYVKQLEDSLSTFSRHPRSILTGSHIRFSM